MNALTTFSYAGSKITFATESGVTVNATQMAKPFGKSAKDWLKTQTAKEFIATFSEVKKILSTDLVRVVYGDNGGTWMHEDVALEFARWLSPKFAIWCNDRIKELLTSTQQPIKAEVLPPPIENQVVTHSLVEYIKGKAVTTSRKLAQALGRKHDSILETIKSNRHQRAFKHGNFTTRAYSSGTSHGYEFLITRKGLATLASVMRYNAKERIAEAYAGAWDASPTKKALPAAETPALPTLAGEPPTYCGTDDEITYTPEQQKYIDWLEGYNEKLGNDLAKAKATTRMYADMYSDEKAKRCLSEKRVAYWHDLYEDLMLRLTNADNSSLGEKMEAHRAFRKRILKGFC